MVPLDTDAFLFLIFTLKSNGKNIRKVANMGRSPSWDPKEERLYCLVPGEQEMGKSFDPALPAYIKSVLPNGEDAQTEVSFKASNGLGTALAVGENTFYYVSFINPEEDEEVALLKPGWIDSVEVA